jgi:hypothetical protein
MGFSLLMLMSFLKQPLFDFIPGTALLDLKFQVSFSNEVRA